MLSMDFTKNNLFEINKNTQHVQSCKIAYYSNHTVFWITSVGRFDRVKYIQGKKAERKHMKNIQKLN